MTEADILPLMIEYMNVFLGGVSVFFAIVSTYIAGLYYFIRRASWPIRLISFTVLTLVLGMMFLFLAGASFGHDGLRDTLQLISETRTLSPAGAALLENSSGRIDIDEYLQSILAVGLGAFYLALGVLTFTRDRRDRDERSGLAMSEEIAPA